MLVPHSFLRVILLTRTCIHSFWNGCSWATRAWPILKFIKLCKFFSDDIICTCVCACIRVCVCACMHSLWNGCSWATRTWPILKFFKFCKFFSEDMICICACVCVCVCACTQFMKRVQLGDARVTNTEILKFCKLFSDDITLDNVGRLQLVNLCKSVSLHLVNS